jgi:hypothetical protein
MPFAHSKRAHLTTAVGLAALLATGASCSNGRGGAAASGRSAARAAALAVVTNTGTPIQLTAQRTTLKLADGTTVPMWGFCTPAQTGGAPPAGTCGGAWAPGPTIVTTAGSSLDIQLTNLLPQPTSIVVLGQVGGGMGTPATMASPAHAGQNFTTFPGNAQVNPTGQGNAFVPPAQGPRVRSFGFEAAAAASTTGGYVAGATQTFSWKNLQPGTYLYETGTLPSLQVPMGLYGVLVVTTAPIAGAGGFTPGSAYPGVSYDADATLLFSEVDPIQNAAVDAAGLASTDVEKRFDDPTCSTAAPCYPAAVNYAPSYFLVNGQWFDRTAPQQSAISLLDPSTVSSTYVSGNVLVRMANAGSRTHVPSLVGTPMGVVAEDGNPAPKVAPAPGWPGLAAPYPAPFKIQSEVLLTAGKTHDAIIRPAPTADGTSYAPATFPVFDRALSLSNGGRAVGGMLAFLRVDPSNAATMVSATGAVVPVPGAPGNLPAGLAPVANPDSYPVPFNPPQCGTAGHPPCTSFSANVTTNDVAVTAVTLGTGVSHGALTLNPDGSFTYVPTTGFSGADGFTYGGNGGVTGAAVTLNVAAPITGTAGTPVAVNDAYTSAFATTFSTGRPGVLANDTDPNNFPLQAVLSKTGTCSSVALNPDGSFSVTGNSSSCSFNYLAMNSQGTTSDPASAATVTVSFGGPGTRSGLQLTVVDATNASSVLTDYRWVVQQDLTFKTPPGTTTPVSTRTVGTSFHRSHMPIVATGCVGAVSCGSGQTLLDPATNARVTVTDAEALARQATIDAVMLDTTQHYYVSVLPGDAGSPPGHAMSGGEVKLASATAWAPLTVRVQPSPLVASQMSIYIYEDSNPTNGQNEPAEQPLGGFNVILFDPAGRTGDVAGQQSYDAFNMPLSNALLGTPGCPDDQNGQTNGTGTSADGNLVGAVYTCPNAPPGYTGDPAVYALAGHALIKNLTPARYDVIAHPGAARDAAGETWWQTETLEGTPAQDAFVGIKEPVYFQEFGPPGPHVTLGFVNPDHVAAYATANGFAKGTATITGKVTNQHMSRPSAVTLYDSGSYDLLSSTTCRVVLNSAAGDGPAVASAECDPDGNFTLSNVPAGDYDLAVFDQWLDQIIQNNAVTVPVNTSTVALGDIPVLSWFTQHDQYIYMDLNKNGRMDPGEPGISNVPLSVRYRNGAPSNVTLTDGNGNGLLVELFPLFNWYVAEADTTRFKQTGVHIYVDGGGIPDTTGVGAHLWSSTYAETTDGSTERTEVPGALSYGVQGFISQRNRIEWGRTPYAAGENGGIVGYVVNSTTRPFDDMRFNVQTIWEPLVPRVKVNLYRKQTLTDGTQSLVLVDSTTTSSFDDFVNLVYGVVNGAQTTTTWMLGPDGVLRDPTTGAVAPANVSAGQQANLQCPGQVASDPFVNYTLGANDRKRCYDGFHAWNQVQAAPYDGRYVFPSPAYVAAHPLTAAQQAAGQTLVSLPAGDYVVEAVTPPGYQTVKEEDKNILIGDAFVAPPAQQFGPLASIFIIPDQATIGNGNPNDPNTGDPGFQSDPTTNLGTYGISTEQTFPACAGTLHRVPDFLSLYPQAQQVAPFAGMDRPLCDRKLVHLHEQMQTSATFFVFTETPAAANNTGIILDDASSEFNALAPDFGEKASVPFVPVSIKDFAGVEIGRTISDQWGAYNMLTPSSWLVNPPTPSGYGPNMLITCINDPGPIPDPAGSGKLVTDPQFNPAYSNFCYTNPFMPGQTTYLDTPVLPVAAFAAGYNPADCALPDAQPAILRVDSSSGFGPWIASTGGTLTITAQGDVQVPNPAYAGPFSKNAIQGARTITRHYGFGAARGRVSIGGVDVTSMIASWTDASITLNIPSRPDLAGAGELSITTAAGRPSIDTVTVSYGGPQPTRVSAGQSIQAAIDAAKPGDLILVDAGTYDELVIMWKPVRLQGVGAASVIINAAKYPNVKLDQWRPRINGLFSVDPVTGNALPGGPAQIDPLPTQEITGGVVLLEPTVLGMEEGAGVTVLAKNLPAGQCSGGATSTWGAPITDSNFLCAQSRIDGIAVTGGDAGGGIYVNGWAHNLEISNNRLYGNAGAYNGGVRVGVPYLELDSFPTTASGSIALTRAQRIAGLGYDVGIKIHHNNITNNGTVEAPLGNGGAGGGISICSGTDGYSVDHNFVCGNLSSSDGGGIGHLGFSQGGTIASNWILFNQSFQQTASTHGGGIAVIGEPPIAGALSLGTGDLTIDANLIRGNFAEAGQGGGIRLGQVNGADVAAFAQPARWHRVTVTNNMIDNNVSGWAGGGISLADTLRANISNNTVASNDNTGIAGVMLTGGLTLPASTNAPAGKGRPAPSGIVSETTSAALTAALPTAGLKAANTVSQPQPFENNVLWHNRSFYYSGDGRLCAGNNVTNALGGACTVLANQSSTGQCVSGAQYWDLGVLGDNSRTPGPIRLVPTYSIVSAGYGNNNNSTNDPGLVNIYCNGSRFVPEAAPNAASIPVNPPTVLNFQVAATIDEGNNYVNLRFGPLYVENPVTKSIFGDYHLTGPNAGAYNAGTSTNAPNHDFDGQPRPYAGTTDIGADEWQP